MRQRERETDEHRSPPRAVRREPPAPTAVATGAPATSHALLRLQRVAGNTAVVQRYFQDPDEGVRVTANERYVLDSVSEDARSKVLWAHPSATPPRYCQASGATKHIYQADYVGYVPATKFYTDCLHTAEEVMAQQAFKYNDPTAPLRSQVHGTGDAFGDTNAGNVAAARAYAQARTTHRPGQGNDDELPAVGQSYSIVETRYRKDPGDPTGEKIPSNHSGFPFHAAAVIAVDGSDTITVEQAAGQSDARARNANGWFSLYQAGSPQLSFYAQNSPNFSGGAIVVVLESKP